MSKDNVLGSCNGCILHHLTPKIKVVIDTASIVWAQSVYRICMWCEEGVLLGLWVHCAASADVVIARVHCQLDEEHYMLRSLQ